MTGDSLAAIEKELLERFTVLQVLRTQHKDLCDKMGAINGEIKLLQHKKLELQPMTLAKSLEVYGPFGENEWGYNFLTEKTHYGEWRDTGVGFESGYNVKSNQRTISVWSNRDWVESKLHQQANLIRELVPLIKPNLDDSKIKTVKTTNISLAVKDLKSFAVITKGVLTDTDWFLVNEGKVWAVVDLGNRFNPVATAAFSGTLKNCLFYIREHLYRFPDYSYNESNDENDDEELGD